MPIYISKDKTAADSKPRVVEADNRAQALRFIAENTFDISTGNATEVARLMADGVQLENATNPQRELDV